MLNQNDSISTQQLEKDERDNLLSDNSLQVDQKYKQQIAESKSQTLQTISKPEDEILDPIEELIKKNNIMPLLAVIDHIDLDRKVEEKPILSIMATKFIPLQKILSNKAIHFPLDDDRRTPLHYAIEANDVKAAAWLISKGNPNQQDNFGNTPILDAIRLGRRRCFLLCLKNNLYDERAPIFAAMYNRHWQLKVLHGMKVDIFAFRDEQNKSSFQRALEYCSFDCAEFMLKIRPGLKIDNYRGFTESKGLIRRLKKIQQKMSIGQRAKQIIRPFLIMSIIYFVLDSEVLGLKQSLPYESTQPFYLILLLLISGLYGMLYIFGTISKESFQYTQKNSLSQILMEPNYKTLEDICPICLHFTNYTYDHCYTCGCCVQKFHFHSIVCVNKSNEVFWVLSEFLWLYLSWSALHQYRQFLQWNSLSISSISSLSLIKLLSQLHFLFEQRNFVGIAWLTFLSFLFLYQVFYCLAIFGMMCMRRKYQQVISSEKYLHLYNVIKVEDNFMNKQKRIFQRGLFGGIKRCARNMLVYFFTHD